jgi:hypothetical protein
MFCFMRGIALGATLLATCEVSLAQEDPTTANFVMPGCREAEINRTEANAYLRGLCVGMVSTLGAGLVPGMCRPANVTNFQMVRVVAKYIDDRPERQHESFRVLAIEAMRAAWPC